MPFIDSKVTVKMSDDQKETLKSSLGQAITTMNKTESYLMVGINDGYDLFMGGKKLDKGAYVEVSVFGDVTPKACDAMTGKICDIFADVLGIPGNAVYVTYQNIHTPWLDKIMVAITSLGNAGILWIVMAAVLLIIPRTRKVGICMAIALVLDLLMTNCLLKNLVARTRPYDVANFTDLIVKKPKDYSFPSGHTAASFAAVTALFMSRKKLLGAISCVIAILIAFSRMYLYVHFPTDIIGGIVVGVAAGVAAGFILRAIDK